MQRDDELSWRKSRRSTSNANCVEVAFTGADETRVRDTKKRDGGTLGFSATAWQAFLEVHKTK